MKKQRKIKKDLRDCTSEVLMDIQKSLELKRTGDIRIFIHEGEIESWVISWKYPVQVRKKLKK